MKPLVTQPNIVSRRGFLRQSFAFSALASLGATARGARLRTASPSLGAAELLMVGDWGYDDDQTAQSEVARGMRRYASEESIHPQALLMLGDNWYGELAGGAQSPRWQ